MADAYGYGPSLWVAPVLDDGEREREALLPRLVATLWGSPRCGSAAARVADGPAIRWRRAQWSVSPEREVVLEER